MNYYFFIHCSHCLRRLHCLYTALLAYAVFIVAFSSYIYLLLLKLYGNMALWVLDYIRIKSYNWLLLSVYSHFPEVGSGHRFRIFSYIYHLLVASLSIEK